MPRKPKAGVAAESTLTLRMTDADRAFLDRLVSMRRDELGDDADVTAASYVRGLIRREAKAKGLTSPPAPSDPSGRTEPPAVSPKAGAEDEPDAKAIRAALLRALERGEVANQIAKRAKLDPGQLSRFRKQAKGLSPEKLTALARALS